MVKHGRHAARDVDGLVRAQARTSERGNQQRNRQGGDGKGLVGSLLDVAAHLGR